jgi:hypothetical protein
VLATFTKVLNLRDARGNVHTIRHVISEIRFAGLGAGLACLKEEARKYELSLRNTRVN